MYAKIKALAASIDLCMQRDRHRLRRRLGVLRRDLKRGEVDDEVMAQLIAEINRSCQRVEQRQRNRPQPDYPEALPVSERRQEIAAAIDAHQVVIVAGETGSGKTTQLPKICLELGRGVAALIGHTQPRRIAARSVAERIASELHSELGQWVGYKVRFSDRLSNESYIKLMTDGILLAETQGDRFLNQYDTLIIDEAHERTLNIDFLLGYLKQLLPKRPDLKLIITSATIDTARFSKHFDNAPVIEVSGRAYPVEVRYHPLSEGDEEARDKDLLQAIVNAVDEVAQLELGDALIFLPGEREIREVAEALRQHHPPQTEILPLYSRLTAAEQNRIFQAHKARRIVLATNVAETSLTVPGIRYVIDPGLARMSRYSHRTKVQRLPIEPISQASANQRAGRCGRTAPGVCIRLYAQEEFELRPEFTDPEIRRSNLAAVILQMKALQLGDIEAFPFVEAPEQKMVMAGYKLLEELGALDPQRQLTKIGQQLAKLPVDPRVARMVLAAREEGALSEVLVIASALTVQDPRERPHAVQQAADEKHKPFRDEASDFLSHLKLWQAYHEQARHLSQSRLRKWCRDNFISYVRIREWRDIHQQLKAQVKTLGWSLNERAADYAAIHRALLSGLLGNIAFKGEQQEYTGARSLKLNIFPGSALFKKGPKWLMAAELVETSRMYARTVARIEAEWIEKIAAEHCRRTVFDAHWERKPAAVIAFERVTLYGLVINPRRRIQYGAINPQEAREIFIRGALVAGDYRTQAPFFAHNRDLIDEIEALEAKSRRRDLLVDEQVLFSFYDQLIPENIYDGRSFERWLKKSTQRSPQLLYLTAERLMQHGADGVSEAQFPNEIEIDGMVFGLSYHFEPGHNEDGVTLTVPLPTLNLLQSERLEWLVPGLLHEKVCQLLKSLPKAVRRSFVPVPNFATAAQQSLVVGSDSLLSALRLRLHKMSGVALSAIQWDLTKLQPHMLMNFRVVDEQGRIVAIGRDLIQLQEQHRGRARQSFDALPVWEGERDATTCWDFGDLPESVEFTSGGVSMRGYPALIDQGESVALKLCDVRSEAIEQSRRGVRRLFILKFPDKIRYLRKELPHLKQMCLYYAPLGACAELQQDLLEAVIDRACFDQNAVPQREADFVAASHRGSQQLIAVANELATLVESILSARHHLRKRLKERMPPLWLHALTDINAQLKALIYPHFIAETPAEWLQEYPRYLKAIQRRLERLQDGVARDRQQMLEVKPLWQAYLDRAAGVASSHALNDYRWMVEELRVSLFAQELKTKRTVSVQRLRKQLETLS